MISSLQSHEFDYRNSYDGSNVETVKESRKNWNFHFDLQLVPIVLEVTFVYCQGAAVISQKAQNFQFVE